MKLTLPLPQEKINAIGQLFFPEIKDWEVFDQERLSEEAKWNGLDIVPKGYRFYDPQIVFHCVQISLDENKGFFESILVYDDQWDVNLTGKSEMDELIKILS